MGGVGHRAHVFALGTRHALGQLKFGDGLRRVGDEPVLERRVDPGARDDLGAVERPHLCLEEIEDCIDGFVGDHALFDQQGFQGFDAGGAVGFPVLAIVKTVHHCCGSLTGMAATGVRLRRPWRLRWLPVPRHSGRRDRHRG